jgi:hypothetical protein
MNLVYVITSKLEELDNNVARRTVKVPDFNIETVITGGTGDPEEFSRHLILSEMRELARYGQPIPLPVAKEEDHQVDSLEDSVLLISFSPFTTLRVLLNNALVSKKKSFETLLQLDEDLYGIDEDTIVALYEFGEEYDLEELLALFNAVPAKISFVIVPQ